jgi:septal ring factor EnvC (AmiA/AmiB activator)
LALPLAASFAFGTTSGAHRSQIPHQPQIGKGHAAPTPQPPPLESLPDLSHAVPAKELSKLPSTADQYRALNSEIGRERPGVEGARAKSDTLRAEADALRQKLIDTAARIQSLEAQKLVLDSDVVRLGSQERSLAQSFAEDRVSVARLLAVLERMQHDMPPAMAVRPDDALGAARSAMLIGASLPEVYGAASALVRRIEALKATRVSLLKKEAEAERNAAELAAARIDLNQLLATKEIQSRAAANEYGDLKTRLDTIAAKATDLKMLLDKVSALRHQPESKDLVAGGAAEQQALPRAARRGAFLQPVVGTILAGSGQDIPGPGVTFATGPGAEVVAPGDATVLFSGPYHKYGHVLILKTALGYDAVLAGLDRVDVRPEDQVLAGEPVGAMPRSGPTARLYFELRQNGHGIDPVPLLTLELRKAKKT